MSQESRWLSEGFSLNSKSSIVGALMRANAIWNIDERNADDGN